MTTLISFLGTGRVKVDNEGKIRSYSKCEYRFGNINLGNILLLQLPWMTISRQTGLL